MAAAQCNDCTRSRRSETHGLPKHGLACPSVEGAHGPRNSRAMARIEGMEGGGRAVEGMESGEAREEGGEI